MGTIRDVLQAPVFLEREVATYQRAATAQSASSSS